MTSLASRQSPRSNALRALAALTVAAGFGGLGVWKWSQGWQFAAGGLPLVGLAAGLWLLPGRRRWWRVVGCAGLLVPGVPLVGLWGYQLACFHGPRPEPTREMLFHGVEYIREVVDEPYPAVVHILRVDLTAEGVEVLVTPPDFPGEDLAYKARTPSTFLREFGVQVAINAGHWYPFRHRVPWDLYPWPGDPVGDMGGSAGRGLHYKGPRKYYPVLNVTEDNEPRIAEHPPLPWYNAVTGKKHFLVDGRLGGSAGNHPPDARTLVAVDEAGHTLFLLVCDGRQGPYSEGLGRGPLAEILKRHGAHSGLALDDGGSSAMVLEGPNGRPRQLSRPINFDIPGRRIVFQEGSPEGKAWLDNVMHTFRHVGYDAACDQLVAWRSYTRLPSGNRPTV